MLDPDRWYRTGDYGRIDDGVLTIDSRRQDLIIRGGENIYPIEIENRLVEHPDVVDAAVIGVDDRELGQEVKAYVVTREGASLDASRGAGVGRGRPRRLQGARGRRVPGRPALHRDRQGHEARPLTRRTGLPGVGQDGPTIAATYMECPRGWVKVPTGGIRTERL